MLRVGLLLRGMLLACLFCGSITVHAMKQENAEPSLEKGAQVFLQKCTLCHGEVGMGEGLLPLKLKSYPNTNLMQDIKARSRDSLHRVVALGAQVEGISDFMPPMGDELTWTELESVVDFVVLLRSNPAQAAELLSNVQKVNIASIKEGLDIFETRCALCHGKSGQGDGRMAKIIKNPPPFDLTASRLPDRLLQQIIARGGEGVGRSKQMPPWSDQLSAAQIESVILYIKTLRD